VSIRRFRPLLFVPVFLLTACGAEPGSDSGPLVSIDTLNDGAVRIHYSSLPSGQPVVAVPELRFGSVEGDPNFVFGDVRGVEAGLDGTIYVLDYLASEIRAFDSSGQFLRKVASEGEGPGELSEANGMILVGDSILWVQDHSKWMMIGLDPKGEELARIPMHVRSYAYVWTGTVDNAGRFWKPTSHSDRDGPFIPEDGLFEGTYRLYLKSFDPSSGAVDSLYLGEDSGRSFVSMNGRLYTSIPFDPRLVTTVDPDGGFWQVHTAGYRVARLNEKGDTTLVIEVDVDPLPVEPEDLSAFMDRFPESDTDRRRAAEEAAQFIRPSKPIIRGTFMDDGARLWIEREVRDGANPHFDVFDRSGDFQGSVQIGFSPAPYRPIRIRHGFLYAVELDELDVPSVVRARVPESVGGGAEEH